MSRIAILASTDRPDVVAGLRKLLPDVSMADLKQRLGGDQPIVDSEAFGNDWEEVHPLLREVIAELKAKQVDFEIHELVDDDQAKRGDASTKIDEATLENILNGFVEEVERARRERWDDSGADK
jgi:hypothetical protein